jgi:hypothetical protein
MPSPVAILPRKQDKREERHCPVLRTPARGRPARIVAEPAEAQLPSAATEQSGLRQVDDDRDGYVVIVLAVVLLLALLLCWRLRRRNV